MSLLIVCSSLWNATKAEGGLANWPWLHSTSGSAKFRQFVQSNQKICTEEHWLTNPQDPRAPTECAPSPPIHVCPHPHSQPSLICIALHTFTRWSHTDLKQFAGWGKVAYKKTKQIIQVGKTLKPPSNGHELDVGWLDGGGASHPYRCDSRQI